MRTLVSKGCGSDPVGREYPKGCKIICGVDQLIGIVPNFVDPTMVLLLILLPSAGRAMDRKDLKDL